MEHGDGPRQRVLEGVINPIGMSATVSSPLEATRRNYNGHQYIFVLNFSYHAKNAQTITLTGIGSATQAVVYGESLEVTSLESTDKTIVWVDAARRVPVRTLIWIP